MTYGFILLPSGSGKTKWKLKKSATQSFTKAEEDSRRPKFQKTVIPDLIGDLAQFKYRSRITAPLVRDEFRFHFAPSRSGQTKWKLKKSVTQSFTKAKEDSRRPKFQKIVIPDLIGDLAQFKYRSRITAPLVRDEFRFHFGSFRVGVNKMEIEKTCYTKLHKAKRRFTKGKSTSLTKCNEQKDILDGTNEVSADLGSRNPIKTRLLASLMKKFRITAPLVRDELRFHFAPFSVGANKMNSLYL